MRLANINRYFRTTTKSALAEVGLQDFSSTKPCTT